MTISEVSRLFGMPMDTLRYYEKIALMDPVRKDGRGHRDYQENDLRRLRFLKLMRSAGVSIEKIKEYVALYNRGEQTLPARKQLLISQREELLERISELQLVAEELVYHIDHFDETLARWELIRRHPDRYTQAEIEEAERERSFSLPEMKQSKL